MRPTAHYSSGRSVGCCQAGALYPSAGHGGETYGRGRSNTPWDLEPHPHPLEPVPFFMPRNFAIRTLSARIQASISLTATRNKRFGCSGFVNQVVISSGGHKATSRSVKTRNGVPCAALLSPSISFRQLGCLDHALQKRTPHAHPEVASTDLDIWQYAESRRNLPEISPEERPRLPGQLTQSAYQP